MTRLSYLRQYRVKEKLYKVDLYKIAYKMVKEAKPFIPGYPKDRPFSDHGLNALVLAIGGELTKIEIEGRDASTKIADRQHQTSQAYCDTFHN